MNEMSRHLPNPALAPTCYSWEVRHRRMRSTLRAVVPGSRHSGDASFKNPKQQFTMHSRRNDSSQGICKPEGRIWLMEVCYYTVPRSNACLWSQSPVVQCLLLQSVSRHNGQVFAPWLGMARSIPAFNYMGLPECMEIRSPVGNYVRAFWRPSLRHILSTLTAATTRGR